MFVIGLEFNLPKLLAACARWCSGWGLSQVLLTMLGGWLGTRAG